MKESKSSFKDLCAKIKLIVLDVDGTLTDGKLYYSEDGSSTKTFNVKDGMGIVKGTSKGITFSIITGRKSIAVEKRAEELGIKEVHQGISNKIEVLDDILKRMKLTYEEVAYMGDDINDIPAMLKVGLVGAPRDSVDEVLELAHFVSGKDGGYGAVREFVEYIMRTQGLYEDVITHYKNLK